MLMKHHFLYSLLSYWTKLLGCSRTNGWIDAHLCNELTMNDIMKINDEVHNILHISCCVAVWRNTKKNNCPRLFVFLPCSYLLYRADELDEGGSFNVSMVIGCWVTARKGTVEQLLWSSNWMELLSLLRFEKSSCLSIMKTWHYSVELSLSPRKSFCIHYSLDSYLFHPLLCSFLSFIIQNSVHICFDSLSLYKHTTYLVN